MTSNIFQQELILEDQAALLRPLVKEDIQYLLPFAMNEPDLWLYALQNPAGAEGMRKWLDIALKNKADEKDYPFIVFDKRAGEYAGSTRFSDIQIVNRTTQISYSWYGKRFHRTGLNRHSKFLLLQFCFEEWDMERVELRADINNIKSIEAIKALGCTVEGILRSDKLTDLGVRRSSMVFSILKNEWFNGVKESLKKKIYD